MTDTKYTDEKGRTWHKFSLEWCNEVDSQTFSTEIWAIDYAHAVDQLEHIKLNGKISGQLLEVIKV